MKRRNALPVLALSLVLGSAVQATPLLDRTTHVLDAVVAPDEEETTLKGEIRSVDADARSFTLVDGDKVHTVKFAADTKIRLDGKTSTAKDALVKGRKVKVVKKGDVIVSISVSSTKS